MDFRRYQQLVRAIPLGKQLPDAIYLHKDALDSVPPELLAHLARSLMAMGLENKDWNVVKFSKRDHKATLLNYPDFFDYAYPVLQFAYTIDLERGTFRKSDYGKSENPPILHRKEVFLKPDHPSVRIFRAITAEGENAGLYKNARSIGFKKAWERLISRRGYTLDEAGRLQCNSRKQSVESLPPIDGTLKVERHLTAIDRDKLSAPMQALARHGYLSGDYSVFDYGCGKGDDARELGAHGIDVASWDPVYYPQETQKHADIVNLGYVINVIEDRSERDQVLCKAFGYCNKVFAVSAMLAGDSTVSQFKRYRDGVITKRNTFQKYFTQTELRSYLEDTLDRNAIAVSPGIFFVFKDQAEEQTFLSKRQHIVRKWTHLTARERISRPLSRDTRIILDRHRELFEDFWNACLDFGRLPTNTEFEFSDRLRSVVGSHKKAFDILINHKGFALFERARLARRSDLMVYLALGLFGKRRPYTQMPISLQRDLKAFFGSYKAALDDARELLFSIGKAENIAMACKETYFQLGCGQLDRGHSLTIHRSLSGDLPPILRVYIGCAAQLYGDIDTIDVIKIHMNSGKVSLMKFDDFDGKPIPRMTQRIKISLKGQEIEVFDYGGRYLPQPLYWKSKLIPLSYTAFDAQLAFDRKLAALDRIDLSGFGPSSEELQALLSRLGLEVKGYDLAPITSG